MKLNQLEYMAAVTKFQSFSAAAMEIHVSQSTLSHQIAKLEDELGVFLFIRSPRSVQLTRAGEEFYRYARKILAEIDNSVDAMQKFATFDKGYIRVGIISSAAGSFYAKIISRFFHQYDGIDIAIMNDHSDKLLEAIRDRNLNLAFTVMPADNDEVDFYPLLNERMFVLLSPAHRLANEASIDLSLLAEENVICMNSGSCYLNNACKELNMNPKIILASDNIKLVQEFVQENIGVALIGSLDAKQIQNHRILPIPLKQTIRSQSGLAVPRTGPPSLMRLPPLTMAFRDFTLAEFSQKDIPPGQNEEILRD